MLEYLIVIPAMLEHSRSPEGGGVNDEKIGNYIRTKLSKNDTEIWIFMDATDSGLDINNIIKIKEELFSTVLDDKRLVGKDIYIVVTTNSYEYTTSFGEHKTDCISVKDCEHITFSDYQDYKEYIIKGV